MLEGALACEGADREAYLAEACGTDTALRAQVEILLAARDRADTFLETPAALLLEEPRARRGPERPRCELVPAGVTPRSGRHGRGVSRARYEAQPRRGAQSPSGRPRRRCRPDCAIQARSAAARVAQPSSYRIHLRIRGKWRHTRAGARARRGPDARRPHRTGSASARRGTANRATNRRSRRGRPRTRRRPSRPEAGQHQAAAGWDRQGARLRPCQGARARRRRGCLVVDVADATAAGRDGHRGDSRNPVVHESRAGAGKTRRQAQRHLGVRLRALRDVDRAAPLRGRGRHRGPRAHHRARAGPRCIAGFHSRTCSAPAAPLPGKGPPETPSRYRRGAYRD